MNAVHAKMAKECWRLICAVIGDQLDMADRDRADLDEAAINLIEMACDSAAESQRIALGHPPRSASPEKRVNEGQEKCLTIPES